MTLAADIQYLREFAGMTRYDLARAMSWTETYIEQVEAGEVKPSAAMLDRLATALGVEELKD